MTLPKIKDTDGNLKPMVIVCDCGGYHSQQFNEWFHNGICAGCSVREPWEHRCHGTPCKCRGCNP